MIVHALLFGLPLCRFSDEVPRDWPEGHRWTPIENAADITCAECAAAATELRSGLPWVVWSYEHDAWWAPHRWGYTRQLWAAGLYTEQDAREIEYLANRYLAPGKRNERAMPLMEAVSAAAATEVGA